MIFNGERLSYRTRAGGRRKGSRRMSEISRQIWDMKYRLKAADGTPVDHDVAESWARVALAAAQAETARGAPRRGRWPLPSALAGHQFLPAGRILAGAGTDRNVTLFNCFVMGRIEDDMGAIFAHLREAALTLQQGGGIGYDFSTLRPKGAAGQGRGRRRLRPDLLHGGVGRDVPHHHERGQPARRDDGDAVASTIPTSKPSSRPSRRAGRLSMFNLSVLVSDDFIEAVKADALWDLAFDDRIYKTVRARESVGPHHARDL